MSKARRDVEEHYTYKQVASLLNLHPDSVRRLVHTGRLVPVRVLSRQIVRIPASTVNRFLERRSI